MANICTVAGEVTKRCKIWSWPSKLCLYIGREDTFTRRLLWVEDNSSEQLMIKACWRRTMGKVGVALDPKRWVQIRKKGKEMSLNFRVWAAMFADRAIKGDYLSWCETKLFPRPPRTNWKGCHSHVSQKCLIVTISHQPAPLRKSTPFPA